MLAANNENHKSYIIDMAARPWRVVKVLDQTNTIAWSPDGGLVVAYQWSLHGPDDEPATIRQLRTSLSGNWGTHVVIKKPQGTDGIGEAAFSPDNRLLAAASSGYDDHAARVWRLS
jgi:WD40 repeat protein